MNDMHDVMVRVSTEVGTDAGRVVEGAVRRGRVIRRRRRIAALGSVGLAAVAAAAVVTTVPWSAAGGGPPRHDSPSSVSQEQAVVRRLAPSIPSAAELDQRLRDALPGRSKPQPEGTQRLSEGSVEATRVVEAAGSGRVAVTLSEEAAGPGRSAGLSQKCRLSTGCRTVPGGWLFTVADSRPDAPVIEGIRETVVTYCRRDGLVVQALALNAPSDAVRPTMPSPVLSVHAVQQLAQARTWLN